MRDGLPLFQFVVRFEYEFTKRIFIIGFEIYVDLARQTKSELTTGMSRMWDASHFK